MHPVHATAVCRVARTSPQGAPECPGSGSPAPAMRVTGVSPTPVAGLGGPGAGAPCRGSKSGQTVPKAHMKCHAEVTNAHTNDQGPYRLRLAANSRDVHVGPSVQLDPAVVVHPPELVEGA